ncbi:glycosyltransferase [Aureispira sp. CCB-QB1]|uniref:glycosyltransferase family protein n=1 Tax=Aureispira sp. CCB-QB1 TaxID=1313421 RepID=UPI0006989BB7|nr:glycosyltransferase [Aureispira sp. CCB-QB1]
MKVFQALHKYAPYIPYFEQKYDTSQMSFKEHLQTLIADRFYTLHILKPALDFSEEVFYTLWDYEALQLKWARENGWNETNLKKILYAQIETYQPDVFYNMSPTFFNKEELDNNLAPSILRICWSASPFFDNELFKLYKTRLTNVPLDVQPISKVGFRSDLFQPAYDPLMDSYAKNTERPIDLFFYGQYARSIFKTRNKQLDRLLEFKQQSDLNIEILLQYRVEKEPVVNIPYIRRFWQKITHPSEMVRQLSGAPIFGLDIYKKISQSKIVFNAGVDFSKEYKVNMRNFEVLGCGAHMLSDIGIYPDGFEMGTHFSTYTDIEDCIQKVEALLKDDAKRLSIAKAGNEMVQTQYTKEKQWQKFQDIVESI